ncbi:hypothetical protein A4D02_23850 [Niastella koreensis]|uniref:Outer membrane protein beta-barrel domain-containing protein n=2 Tax=Niastella koreensis TaxID=354356 RepID=G8TC57_NIAKG|nr:STN domain-containing protein [Niastella koreensis]AEW00364.1 hypothetical protein Niako_4085 [Niastella koreensis GR20-10]OQP52231.1 hypothetical protein A4D02_23850 [Niastella koreensis]
MDVIKKSILWLFVLLGLAMTSNCMAQQKAAAAQFYFDKPITLDSLTRYVHSHSRIRFAFNSSKVKGDKVINLKKGKYTIGLLLKEIRKNTSLYYLRYNGYVIFQDNPPKQKAISQSIAKKNKPPITPVRRAEPTDTAHITAHTNPDSLNRVIVVNSPKPVDTVYRKVKDTIGLSLGMGALETERKARSRNGHDKSVEDDNWQLKQGTPLTGPVTIDSLKERRWVKDTMPGKTKTINTTISKKEERAIARSSRNSGYANYGQPGGSSNWQFGLHWKAALPINGSSYYFTGPNNSSQLYNPLIPGIWLSWHHDPHEFLLLVKPAEWTVYGNNVVKADTSIRKYGTDSLPSLIPLRRTTSFIKSGGIYAGLQYNYHLNENFTIDAGIGYQTLGQTLVQLQTKRIYDTGVNGQFFPDTLFTAKGDSLTSKYLKSSLILAKFEVAYKLGSVDLGAAVLLPLTPAFTSQSRDQKKPLSYQIFIRWRLKREEEPL